MANRKKEVTLKYPPELKNKVVAAYLARAPGVSAADIGKEHGVPVPYIYNWQNEVRHGQAPWFTGPIVPKEIQEAKSSPETQRRLDADDGGKRKYQIYSIDFKREVIRTFENRKAGVKATDIAEQFKLPGPSAIFAFIRDLKKLDAQEGSQEKPVTGALVPGRRGRQAELFPGEPLATRVEPHISPHSVDRMKGDLSKLHKRIAALEEDNAILRAIASVAHRRGVLNLFGTKGDDE